MWGPNNEGLEKDDFAKVDDAQKLYDVFFSSRRRHTRWNCDWSSDVCSSDLCWWRRDLVWVQALEYAATRRRHRTPPRSEERRVGKECRSRWSPHNKNKKSDNEALKRDNYATVEPDQ